jgi:hypothetical protein
VNTLLDKGFVSFQYFNAHPDEHLDKPFTVRRVVRRRQLDVLTD